MMSMSYLRTAEGASGGNKRPANLLANAEEFPPLRGATKPTTPTTPSVPQQGAQQAQGGPAGDSEIGKYGLNGVLQIIRMTDPDLNTLALGYDLTTLGLSLNSPDYLYSTLCCPWSDSTALVQPEYRLPQCYSLQPPHLRFQIFQKFHLETLFYIFYSMPRDVLQLAAAQELYNRDWRFHKEHKLWFTRAPDSQPAVKTTTYERGNYLVFDPERWRQDKRDDFVLVYDQLDDKTAMQEARQHSQQMGEPQQPSGMPVQPDQQQPHQEYHHQQGGQGPPPMMQIYPQHR